MKSKRTSGAFLGVAELCIFAMLGALTFASKVLMELLPNVHLIGMFIVVFTVVFRAKALFPIYVFVFLTGLYGGFALWWIPYLYIWTVLWGVTMLLPRKMKRPLAVTVYALVCGLHGLCYGVLYAPAQALMFGLNFKQMLAWIAAGLPFDLIHGISNFAVGLLIVPLSELLSRLKRHYL